VDAAPAARARRRRAGVAGRHARRARDARKIDECINVAVYILIERACWQGQRQARRWLALARTHDNTLDTMAGSIETLNLMSGIVIVRVYLQQPCATPPPTVHL